MIDLDAWFRKMPGLMVLKEEKAVLDRILKTMRGNDLLQVGGSSDNRLIEQARVLRTFFIDSHSHFQSTRLFIQASTDCLPVQSESMDIVLLMHSLESSKKPQKTIAEAYRVLRPNGQLIIFGFNCWSLWRLPWLWRKRYYTEMKKCHSRRKIETVLRACDFDIAQQQTLCFRPLFKNKSWARTFLFLEAVGQFLLPSCGGVYMMHATKNISGVTPLVVQNARLVETRIV
ncbi:MAG: methyltransferase domain-containing protein [Gammaproteobacteria bacterium]|nr:methyltransferase domain-containing protein [Gammaproteobacteria bacterium]